MGRSIGEALRAARARLATGGVEDADLDARLLLGHVADLDGTALFLRERDPLPAEAAERLEAVLRRRLDGEPTYRIIGRRAFFDHEFTLSPDTLEPRPDTEALVHLASRALARRPTRSRFADVGTGTGILAVSLLALHAETRCVAIDLAEGALWTAWQNACDAGVADRFRPLRSDFLDALASRSLDLVVSNPPYIPTGDLATLSREVREHDPVLALDGGADGLLAFRRIAKEAARVLRPGGALLFEIGRAQEADVERILADSGFVLTATERDLGEVVRALQFEPVPPESHRNGENRV